MKVHPVFILGIIICAIPPLTIIVGLSLPGWIFKIGIVVIVVGAALTMFKGDD